MRTRSLLLPSSSEFAEFASDERDGIALESWPGSFDLVHDELNLDPQTCRQTRVTNQGEIEFARLEGRGRLSESGPIKRAKGILVFKVFTAHSAFLHCV